MNQLVPSPKLSFKEALNIYVFFLTKQKGKSDPWLHMLEREHPFTYAKIIQAEKDQNYKNEIIKELFKHLNLKHFIEVTIQN